MKTNRTCPLCGERMMTGPDDLNMIYCAETVTLPGGRRKSHYMEDGLTNMISMYVMPYRISTNMVAVEKTSKIGYISRYKTGRKSFYFKTLATCPEIHPDTEDKLRTRIKTLLTFS